MGEEGTRSDAISVWNSRVWLGRCVTNGFVLVSGYTKREKGKETLGCEGLFAPAYACTERERS